MLSEVVDLLTVLACLYAITLNSRMTAEVLKGQKASRPASVQISDIEGDVTVEGDVAGRDKIQGDRVAKQNGTSP